MSKTESDPEAEELVTSLLYQAEGKIEVVEEAVENLSEKVGFGDTACSGGVPEAER